MLLRLKQVANGGNTQTKITKNIMLHTLGSKCISHKMVLRLDHGMNSMLWRYRRIKNEDSPKVSLFLNVAFMLAYFSTIEDTLPNASCCVLSDKPTS